MSAEHTHVSWASVGTSIAGAGITIADLNAWVTLMVGLATLVFTVVKIWQALNGAARDRETLRKLYRRMSIEPTEPGEFK